MEERKLIYIACIIITIILIGMLIGMFFYFRQPTETPGITPIADTNTNDHGYLPGTPGLPTASDGPSTDSAIAELAKEKQFISSFWRPFAVEYAAQAPSYELPLSEVKEQVTNYRDFSRKIDIEPILEKLAKNGFAVINNPFSVNTADWDDSYGLIKENTLPVFITADSVVGLYQDTLHIIYKEIEGEIFYPSLWELLKEIFYETKKRYEAGRQQFGIEGDIITEANRLELAYLTVALKLLQPEQAQIKESLTTEKKFFSPQEAEIYNISIPQYLADEVNQEIKLIDSKTKTAKSAVFLYENNYQNYAVPRHYQTSERLKNYYLAITWLNNILFPLWSRDDDCPACPLDQQDQVINFIAGLYLSEDLGSDQDRKNQWANIYKSISFFKGLETGLTYLDYQLALEDVFGPDYILDDLFSDNLETTKKNIAQLQEKLNSYTFLKALSRNEENKEKAGFRLLKNYGLLEDNLFSSLTGLDAGKYLGEAKLLPFTACFQNSNYYRCLASGLDIFNLLENPAAKEILAESNNSNYENYQQKLGEFSNQLNEFDRYTWHDNAYLSLLSSLKNLDPKEKTGLPAFMKNDSWAKKSLNMSLASWVNSHREITLEKVQVNQDSKFESYFPYGYIEPQIEFYGQLLSNVKMITDGFVSLQIISDQSKPFERLKNLEATIEKIIQICKKESEGILLDIDDYDLINNFSRHIKTVTGDIKNDGLKNNYTFSYKFADNKVLNQYIDGLNYLIVIYPSFDDKMFFAIGPVLNYQEGKSQSKNIPEWQQDFRQ